MAGNVGEKGVERNGQILPAVGQLVLNFNVPSSSSTLIACPSWNLAGS
jgi:hypothetical protein